MIDQNIDAYASLLAKELGVDTSSVQYVGKSGYTDYGYQYKIGDKIYDVFSGDDADAEFLERVKELPNATGDWPFGSEFPIENYIDPDAFDDYMTEHSESYAEDIEYETVGYEPYANRFISECVERGVVDEDNLVENSDGLLDFANEDDHDSAIEDFVDDYNNDYADSVNYMLYSFGEKYIIDMFNDGNVDIDFDLLADDIASSYSRGHEISSYDGYEIELDGDVFAYRQN